MKIRSDKVRQCEHGGVVNWIIIGVVVVGLGSLFVYNVIHHDPSVNAHTVGMPWNANMTMGKADTPNKFVQYSDYFCYHCSKVHEARNGTDFKKDYIDSGKVYYEMRIVAVLDTPNTPRGAEAAYCAADQNKYWEYTDAILDKINADYFSKNVGLGPGYPSIELLPVTYYSEPATSLGMDKAKFENCVTNNQHEQEIQTATNRALSAKVTGLPFLVVNDYTSNGFAGGYANLQAIMKAGGVE